MIGRLVAALVLGIGLMILGGSRAQALDGQTFWSECSAKHDSCPVYIWATVDQINHTSEQIFLDRQQWKKTGLKVPKQVNTDLDQLTCRPFIPDNTAIDALADIVTQYMADHPDSRNQEAVIIVFTALQAKYGCTP